MTLLVLGAIEAGGSGCACPESVLIRALVTDLVLHRKDALVMDMEAGIEHLGRATARGVDTLLVMVEPSQRAVDSAHRVVRLGRRDRPDATSGSWPTRSPVPADEEFVRAGAGRAGGSRSHSLVGGDPRG